MHAIYICLHCRTACPLLAMQLVFSPCSHQVMCRERHLYVITVKQTDRLHVCVYLSSPVQASHKGRRDGRGLTGFECKLRDGVSALATDVKKARVRLAECAGCTL